MRARAIELDRDRVRVVARAPFPSQRARSTRFERRVAPRHVAA